MNLKKMLALLSVSALTVSMLAACSPKPVVAGPEETKPAETTPVETAPAETGAPAGEAVKTGLSFVADLGKSKDATAEKNGQAQTNVSLVAVAVNDEGVIVDCIIDAIQSKIDFTTEGVLATDLTTTFESKNVLGDEYGMRKASSISKEWNEQVAALAEFAKGKTVEELKGMAIDETGMAKDADLAASATLYLGGFVSSIEDAVNNAEHRGAMAGDKLALTSVTTIAKSKDATAEKDGVAQAYSSVAMVTLNGETVTSCYIDAVQANVNFDTTGTITSDLTVAPETKNTLGEGYGMKKASSIGKEWNEQLVSFCEYVTGKTVTEITGIAMDESTAPTDADLTASVTVKIGEYVELIAEAAK